MHNEHIRTAFRLIAEGATVLEFDFCPAPALAAINVAQTTTQQFLEWVSQTQDHSTRTNFRLPKAKYVIEVSQKINFLKEAPLRGEEYTVILSDGDIHNYRWAGDAEDRMHLENRQAFKTTEDAMAYQELINSIKRQILRES